VPGTKCARLSSKFFAPSTGVGQFALSEYLYRRATRRLRIGLPRYPYDAWVWMISEPGIDQLRSPLRPARRVALQLDVPGPPVCFKDEVVASGVDIRSNHLDTVMPDEPAMLEHVR
jgi:hypothetical protein